MNLTFRALRDITSSLQEYSDVDWSPARGGYSIQKFKRKGIKCICIYVRGHYINNYKRWRRTRVGRNIARILERSKYRTYLRCLALDSFVENTWPDDQHYIEGVLRKVADCAYERGDKENLAIYSCCSMCYQICTFNFANEWNNTMRYDYRFCSRCYNKYLHNEHFPELL